MNGLLLLPQPLPPGLYLTLGSDALATWALEEVTRTAAGPAHIVWIDGANAFNAYIAAVMARVSGKDPRAVLGSYQVARPFTAYQLERMVSEKAIAAVRRCGALFTVLSDPLSLFKAAQGRDTQVRFCFERFVAGLRALAEETAVLCLIQGHPPAHELSPLVTMARRIVRLSLTPAPELALLSPAQALSGR